MKAFNAYLNESIELDEIKRDYYMPNENAIKKTFNFVGEGVDDIDILDHYTPVRILINFFLTTSPYIAVRTWVKVVKVLNKWKSDGLIDSYIIDTFKSQIMIDCIKGEV